MISPFLEPDFFRNGHVHFAAVRAAAGARPGTGGGRKPGTPGTPA